MRVLLQIIGFVMLFRVDGLVARHVELRPADRRADAVVDPASDEAFAAIDHFERPRGLTMRLWAAEPMFVNPVAITFDEQGRLFVAETHRLKTSALNLDDYPELLEQDLAIQTIEDRARLTDEAFGEHVAQLAIESERVRLLEDTDGDGAADASHVFATGFNTPLDGIAAGILARGNQVWLTCIPSLWKLTPDASGTQAASRKEVLRGFGVHIGIAGHGLHGLATGPDGRLYFSMGDRGAHLECQDGKPIHISDTGAVFRCDPDGGNFQVVATGLRNPQDLAFDDFGNLFTADSDSGNGDLERLIYVVDGGDSGWRVGYEHAPLGKGGPWMRDGLWKPHFKDRPAYALPPVCNIEDGPRGLAYYPGSGLTTDFNGNFFLCHFKDSVADSGIQTYALRPRGAGFEVAGTKTFLRGALPTDITFGPDGRLYFSDWVSRWPWPKPRRGRIYAVESSSPDATHRATAGETRRLLAEGMAGRPPNDLIAWLGHDDQRVRLAAQFELAARGAASLPVFEAVAKNSRAPRLARLHALWGMGQLAEPVAGALNVLPSLLEDKDSEVRAQAARLIGDYFRFESFRFLVAALQDPEPRVAFFAAQSLGKLKRKDSIPALISLLRRNDDKDPVLRHAVVIALARLGPDPALANTVKDPSRAVRLGGLLAYRRLKDPTVALYLEDFDPYVVREAARAINDVPIEGAMPALAALLELAPLDDDALVLRAINAHFHLGGTENASALADFAGRVSVPAVYRAEALNQLAMWAKPPARDRITGLYHPLPPREAEPARQAFGDFLARLAGKAPEQVQIATIRAVAELEVPGTGHALWDVVFQSTHPLASRIAALQALEKLNDPRLEVAAQTAGRSQHPELRMAALPILSRRNPAVSLPTLKFLAGNGTPAEQAMVFSILEKIEDARSDQILIQAMHRFIAGEVPQAAQAELLAAATARRNPELAALAQQLQSRWSAGADRLAPYRSALEGGDKVNGRRLFERHPALACLRCHEHDRGGDEAGPSLAGIGARQSREELLESVVLEHPKIAPGFEQVALMELRDLIAYLSSLKSQPDGASNRPRALQIEDEIPARN